MMYTQEPLAALSMQLRERGLSLISASAGQIEGGANMFTAYTCSLTMAEMTEGKNSEHLYFPQFFCYEEEQRTSSLPTSFLLQ